MNGKQVAERMVEAVMEFSPVNQGPALRALAQAADKLYMACQGDEEDEFFEALLDTLTQAVQEKLPPFVTGQTVFIRRGRHQAAPFIVDACERAFGDWAVKGHFPHNDQPYIYPATMLEAD